MYAGDSDDTMVLAGLWNDPSNPAKFKGGDSVGPWSWLIQPYVKNGAIFEDPSNSPTPSVIPGASISFSQLFVPEYGYNYTYLTPVIADAAGNPLQQPISATLPADPSGTVLFTSKWGYSESSTATTGYWAWGPQGPPFWTTVEVPDCNDAPAACNSTTWGTGDPFLSSTAYEGITTTVAGAQTGGVSLHAGGLAVVSFVDGHTKKMTPGALAAGTNWTPTIASGAVIMTDKTKYLWDTD